MSGRIAPAEPAPPEWEEKRTSGGTFQTIRLVSCIALCSDDIRHVGYFLICPELQSGCRYHCISGYNFINLVDGKVDEVEAQGRVIRSSNMLLRTESVQRRMLLVQVRCALSLCLQLVVRGPTVYFGASR
jgi:hypothetical protein